MTTPRRVAGWNQRLVEYLERHSRTVFEWGVHDCARFAAGAVDAQCGTNLIEQLDARLTYTNETEAAALVQGGFREVVNEFLGLPSPPLLGRRGDIVLFRATLTRSYGGTEFERGLAVHDGQQLLSLGTHGYMSMPLECAETVWRLG